MQGSDVGTPCLTICKSGMIPSQSSLRMNQKHTENEESREQDIHESHHECRRASKKVWLAECLI